MLWAVTKSIGQKSNGTEESYIQSLYQRLSTQNGDQSGYITPSTFRVDGGSIFNFLLK